MLYGGTHGKGDIVHIKEGIEGEEELAEGRPLPIGPQDSELLRHFLNMGYKP